MKKIFLLLVVLAGFSSCSENITRNNPSVQGLKDDVLWRAGGSSATIGANGELTITAAYQFETLVLKTTSTVAQVYPLGTSVSKQATFIYSNGGQELTYSTGIDQGDGQIVIKEYDAVNNTVTGTFRFNAINTDQNPLGGPTLNFQQGIFYKVPVYPSL